MKPNQLQSIFGLTINMETLKCFRLNYFEEENSMTIEFKTRFDYIINPETGEFEKQEYNDTTVLKFYNLDSAEQHNYEFQAAWKAYLEQ